MDFFNKENYNKIRENVKKFPEWKKRFINDELLVHKNSKKIPLREDEKYMDIFDYMIVDDGRLMPIDDVFKNVNKLKDYITRLKEQRDRACEELKEYNKDEKIQKLQKEINQLKNKKAEGFNFNISKEELAKINTWKEKHVKKKHDGSYYAGAIGGMFTYQFIPTSIGDIGEIICSCGEKYCFRELE